MTRAPDQPWNGTLNHWCDPVSKLKLYLKFTRWHTRAPFNQNVPSSWRAHCLTTRLLAIATNLQIVTSSCSSRTTGSSLSITGQLRKAKRITILRLCIHFVPILRGTYSWCWLEGEQVLVLFFLATFFCYNFFTWARWKPCDKWVAERISWSYTISIVLYVIGMARIS